MQRFLAFFIIVLVFFLSPARTYAASGHVACEYDLYLQNWVWEIGLSQSVTNWLTFGTTLRTYANDFEYRIVIPSWVPEQQGYEVWAEARAGDFTFRLTDWCDHWLAQSRVLPDWDRWGLRFRIQYNF